MKPRKKNTRIAPPTKTRRLASERDAAAFFTPADAWPENPDWLVGAD